MSYLTSKIDTQLKDLKLYSHAPNGYICPFCLLVQNIESELNQARQTDIVYQNNEATAFIATRKYPLNTGHVLVIPNQHFENIFDLPAALAVKIHELARGVALAMKLAYGCDGIMLRQHNEPAGDQHIWHYHLHIIPRYQNDRFYTSQREPFPPDERATYALRLKMCLKDLNPE
jgi:histidine triad (HIT) family protein